MSDEPVKVGVIRLWSREDYCCICDTLVMGGDKGIPMYEGVPVPPDWEDDWGGFTACDKCFEKYENGQLEMWEGKSVREDQEIGLRRRQSNSVLA